MLLLNKSSIIFVLPVVTITNKKACCKETTFGVPFCITCIESFPDYSFQFELLKAVNYQNYLYQNDVLAGKFLDSKAKIILKKKYFTHY